MIKTGVSRGALRFKGESSQKFVQKVIDNVLDDTIKIAKKHTPIDTGLARRSWRRKAKSVVNNTDYIIPLEDGHSRQSPDGIGRPTVKEVKANFKKGKYDE